MSRSTRSRTWSILAALLINCAPAPATRAGGPAWPEVRLPDGAIVKVELARTPGERSQGLMFRESMPADRGMLFVFEREEPQSFYMRNCFFPQDWVFLDAAGTVTEVMPDRPPCPADPCPAWTSKGPARYVLELNAGAAKRHGVTPGARLGLPKVVH
jgi:hypothetical protein